MTNRPNPFSKLRDLAGKRRQPNDPFGASDTDALNGEELYGDYVPNYVYDDGLKDALADRMKAHNLSFPEDPNDERYTDLLRQARDIDRSLASNIQQARVDIAVTRDNPLLRPEQLRARRAAGGRELLERIFYVENSSGHPTLNKGLIGGLLLASATALFFLMGTPVNTEEAASTGDGITVTAADGTTTTTYPDRTVQLSTNGIETTTYPDKREKVVDLKTGVTTVRYPDKVVTVTQKDGSYVKTLADGTVLRYDSTGELAVNLPPGQIDSALNDPSLIQTPNTVPSSPVPPTISGADMQDDPAVAGQTAQDSGAVGAIAPPPDGSDFDTDSTLGGIGTDTDDTGESTVSTSTSTGNPNDVAGPITPAEDPYTYVPDEPVSTVQSSPVQPSVDQPSPLADPTNEPGGAGADPYGGVSGDAAAQAPSTVITLPQPGSGAVGSASGAAGPEQAVGAGTAAPTPSTVTIRRASALPPPTASDLAGGRQNAGSTVFSGGAVSGTSGAGARSGNGASGGAGQAGGPAGPITATYSSGVDHSATGGSGAPQARVIGRQPAAPAANVLRRSAGEGANSPQGRETVVFRRKTSADTGGASPAGQTTSPANTPGEQYAVGSATDTTGLMASAQGAGAAAGQPGNAQGASPATSAPAGSAGRPGAGPPAGGAPAAQTPAGLAPSPYKAGQYLRATLETGMVLPADGGGTPDQGLMVFARTADGTLWLGTPSISPTRRMTLSFSRAQLRDGTEIAVNAQAYNNDGTPGVKAEFKPEAPSLVDDLIRSTISGVRDYAEAKIQATRTTVGIGGTTVVERQVPTIFESVAASAAGVFQLPPTQATFINTARVNKGQSFVIVITPPLRNSVE